MVPAENLHGAVTVHVAAGMILFMTCQPQPTLDGASHPPFAVAGVEEQLTGGISGQDIVGAVAS